MGKAVGSPAGSPTSSIRFPATPATSGRVAREAPDLAGKICSTVVIEQRKR
jgi:hypothetical protein